MKTAKEIASEYFKEHGKVYSINDPDAPDDANHAQVEMVEIDTDNFVLAMEEYAAQFYANREISESTLKTICNKVEVYTQSNDFYKGCIISGNFSIRFSGIFPELIKLLKS
jgi:hypothetical protein